MNSFLDSFQNTPLHWAILNKDTRLSSLLLNLSLPQPNASGFYPKHDSKIPPKNLLFAAFHALPDVTLALLQQGAHVHQTDDQGKSPLFLASLSGNTAIVSLLLQHHAHPDFSPSFPPLLASVFMGHEHITRLLVDADANINISFSSSDPTKNILHLAACLLNPSMVQLLIQRGCSIPDQPDKWLPQALLDYKLKLQKINHLSTKKLFVDVLPPDSGPLALSKSELDQMYQILALFKLSKKPFVVSHPALSSIKLHVFLFIIMTLFIASLYIGFGSFRCQKLNSIHSSKRHLVGSIMAVDASKYNQNHSNC
jgi:ankyrin repeat protein